MPETRYTPKNSLTLRVRVLRRLLPALHDAARTAAVPFDVFVSECLEAAAAEHAIRQIDDRALMGKLPRVAQCDSHTLSLKNLGVAVHRDRLDIKTIRTLRARGFTIAQVARRFGISPSSIAWHWKKSGGVTATAT